MKTVIKMAREAGFSCLLPDEAMDMIGGVFEGDTNLTKTLERFAALVREDVYKSDDMTTAYMAGFRDGSYGLKDRLFNAIIDSEDLYKTLSLHQIEAIKTIIGGVK